MARKSTAEKADSRLRILTAAADLIRQNGIEGTSVSEIMDRAGMTHGGFYRHFESKGQLVAEAISEAFRAGLDVFDDDAPGTAEQADTYVDQYLSEEHITEPQKGCPMPVLSPEVARGDEAWGEALSKGLSTASTKLAQGIDDMAQREALALLSLLVGTISLARGVGEGQLRNAILKASEEQIRLMMKK